jgi:hypothetical protein
MSYSFETKLAEVEYEIKMRHQVYPGSVKMGRMKEGQAEMKIAIMEAIAEDYRGAIQRRDEKVAAIKAAQLQQEPQCESSSATAAGDNATSST